MQAQHVNQETDAIEKVWAFFTPGVLSDKCREIAALREAGATQFFDGEIKWRVTLLAEDKTMNGKAETLDRVCADIQSCLNFLVGQYAPDVIVECSIEPSSQ